TSPDGPPGPRLVVALDLAPPAIPLGTAGVTLAVHQRAQLLHLDLPPAAALSTRAGALWLPEVSVDLAVAGPPALTTPSLAGLRLSADAVRLGAIWRQQGGFTWTARVDNPSAEWVGELPGSLTLPDLRFGGAFDSSWSFGDVDFGADLSLGALADLGALLRFAVGRWLLERGGSAGFGLAGLLGLLPNPAELELPDLPDWTLGPLALPLDWPTLQVDDWAAFFADPWPDLRAHLGRLLAKPEWAWPALQWLGATIHGMLPDLSLPDLGWQRVSLSGGESEIRFPTLPFTITGAGTYADPWAIAVNREGARGIQALVWLDPDGPPSGEAVDVAVALAPQGVHAIADLVNDASADLPRLVSVAEALATVDRALEDALRTVDGEQLAAALTTLAAYLKASDGVVLTASQQPADASWNAPAQESALEQVHHGAQLASDAIATAIKARIDQWSGGAPLPVLLLGAPWESAGAWATVLAKLGVAGAPHFDLFEFGVDPEQVSLAGVTAGEATGTRVYTADLAVFNTAPGVAPAGRPVPVDATGTGSSQAKQVSRLIDRVRALHSGKKVIIVAHSSAGLAARAAITRDGTSTRVRGLITVGTPHLGSTVPWLADAAVAEAVAFLGRADANLLPNPQLRAAVRQLLTFINGEWTDDRGGQPLEFPAHSFQPAGSLTLPTGVAGHALATRLPQDDLRDQIATWLTTRAAALRAALDARKPVTHVGLGVRLLPPPVTASGVEVSTTARVDITRANVTGEPVDAGAYGAVPRLEVLTTLVRPGGWLVGGPGASPRLRWAELGVSIAPDRPTPVTPVIRLHDGHVDGVAAPLSGLRQLASGSFEPEGTLRRLLDEVMRQLTRGSESVLPFESVCELLEHIGLAMPVGTGYGVVPDAFSALLADPAAYARTQLAAVLGDATKRDALLAALRELLELPPGGGLSRVLAPQPGDPPALACLREVLAALDLMTPASQGFVVKPFEWLKLVRNPVAELRARAEPLLGDETRRSALVNAIRQRLGLDDIAAPESPLVALGAKLTFKATSTGRVSACIVARDAIVVGGAVQVYGCLHLDVGQRSLTVEAKVRPVGLSTAVAATYTLAVPGAPTAGVTHRWGLALDWSDADFPAAYEPLELFPVPEDLAARLGNMLPRFLLSTFAGSVIEAELLPRVPAAGPLLQSMGLAYRLTSTAPWRLRPLDGLLVDPVGWLLSPQAMGTATGELDPSKLVSVATELARVLGLATTAGTITLPYGVSVRATQGTPPTIAIEIDPPLPLPGGGTLDLSLALRIAAGGQVGVGGQVEVRYPLPDIPGAPDMWDEVMVAAGFADGAFTVRFGTDTVQLDLLPFRGWSAALLGLANPQRLLPTMVNASVQALEQRGSSPALAQLGDLVAHLRALAQTLQLDSVAGLDAMLDNPVSWVQQRFSAANAPATATVILDVLKGRLPNVSRAGGLVSFRPGNGPVTIALGRNSVIGLSITVTDLAAGPLLIDLTASAGIGDAPNPPAQFDVDVELAVAPNVIDPGGVSIEPMLHFGCAGTFGAAPQIDFYAYPVGNKPGSPDFRLDILPTFKFSCDDGGTMTDCLLEFARRILLPGAVEMLLDTPAVTQWLKVPLIAGKPATQPGQLLVDANVLTVAGNGFNLVPLAQFTPSQEPFVASLIGSGLSALAGSLNNGQKPLVTLPGGGIFVVSRPAPGGGTQYGLRVQINDIEILKDPAIKVETAGDTGWIKRASSTPRDPQPGLGLYLLRKSAAGAYDFAPTLELVSVGIDAFGAGGRPLIDLSAFRLGGISARLYLSVDFPGGVTAAPTVAAGGMVEAKGMGIPLGTAGGNPVAQNLLAPTPGGGEKQAVNPSFDLGLGYVDRLDVRFGDRPEKEVWIPIQRMFGPVHVGQIGVRWDDDIGLTTTPGPDPLLTLLIDGGVKLSGLAVAVDDLGLGVPVKTAGNLSTWRLGLKGLGVGYDSGGVKIAGGLLQVGGGTTGIPVRYDGLCLIEAAGRTFAAFGSYMQDPYTSLFVFVVASIPIGGPPYFFITGLAGGFGYNRDLIVPSIEGVSRFPLVSAAVNPGSISSEPMKALEALGTAIPPQQGAYWLAAGIRFSSCELVKSFALLYVLLDEGFEIGLLGLAKMELPEGKPLVNVELALRARLVVSPTEGVFSVEAQLTNNSWLLSRDCRLTGGFAFYIWFKGQYAGDFVITLGGYNKKVFAPPSHYPVVPRVGFSWYYSSEITIKGESYFALTPSCVMAGGLLEASYHSGSLKAWFKAWADFLIAWEPFAYYISVGVTVGASYRVRVDLLLGTVEKTFEVELGADVEVWGPRLAGKAHVKWWVISFTVRFGANDSRTPELPLSWDAFRTRFLPAENSRLFFGLVERGLIGAAVKKSASGTTTEVDTTAPWMVGPEFVLATETAIASNVIEVVGRVTHQPPGMPINVGPMRQNGLESRHVVSVLTAAAGQPAASVTNQFSKVEYLQGNAPAAMWAPYVPPTQRKADARRVPALLGVRLVASVTMLESTGPVGRVLEEGRLPLPFARELERRRVDWGQPAVARLPRVLTISVPAHETMRLARVILGSDTWAPRRRAALERLSALGLHVGGGSELPVTTAYLEHLHVAPPRIAPLEEGLGARPVHVTRAAAVRPPRPAAAAPAPPPLPTLRAVVRQRPEPTRPTVPAVRTTVARVARAGTPRVPIAEVIRGAGLGGAVGR
ncbi:MAG TPA: DUF6603 domain-containing protein, partial [Gemmatimonadaceae bacterium]|nr:DUF6603 domain-containing protein [Gemmatimonadaceae bacterium]